MADGFQKQAFFGIAGDDRVAGVAAFLPAVAEVETQAALLLFCVVALVAFACEDGTDFRLKKIRLLLRERGGRECGASDAEENERCAWEGHRWFHE